MAAGREEEYSIVKDKIGKKLLELDGKSIKFSGTFNENEDGANSIKVQSFSVINDSEESEEDEPEED